MNMYDTIMTECSKDRSAWKEKRRGKLGASEIAIISGLSPYKSPLELWCEKTGRTEEKEDSDYLWLGREMEPIIGKLVAKKKGWNLQGVDELWESKSVPWAVASPDFLILDDQGQTARGLLEAKTANINQKKYWAEGNVPDSYACQLQWQLGVSGFEEGAIACLVAGEPGSCEPVTFERNKDIFNQLVDLGESFLEGVRTDTPPAATTGDDFRILSVLHGTGSGGIVELPASAEELFEKHQSLKTLESAANKEARELNDERKRIEACILQLLGGASIGILGNKKAEFKLIKRAAYEVKETSWGQLTIKEIKS